MSQTLLHTTAKNQPFLLKFWFPFTFTQPTEDDNSIHEVHRVGFGKEVYCTLRKGMGATPYIEYLTIERATKQWLYTMIEMLEGNKMLGLEENELESFAKVMLKKYTITTLPIDAFSEHFKSEIEEIEAGKNG